MSDTGPWPGAPNPYGRSYGTKVPKVPAPVPSPITVEQGDAILQLMLQQLELLKSIERQIVLLNRRLP